MATAFEKAYSMASDDTLRAAVSEVKHNITTLYSMLPPLPKKAPPRVLSQIKKLAQEGRVIIAELEHRKITGRPRNYELGPRYGRRYRRWRS